MSDIVRFCGDERSTFTTKRLTNSGRNKGLFFGTCATLFVAVVSVLLFYGCKKDILKNGDSKNSQAMMSMGNHSQPTQNIDIQTYFSVGTGTVTRPVTGNAVVGSYNGQIYECNLNWTMAVGTYTGYEISFEAALKSGLDGTEVGLTNGMQNYDIAINGQEIGAEGYSEVIDDMTFTITPDDISMLWSRVKAYVAENVVIITPPIVFPPHKERAFPQYENYDPSDNIMQTKLKMINKCVNYPDENNMPNMEIKEAVWFLETYFNIAIGGHPEEFTGSFDSWKTYFMDVPITNTGGQIMLNGLALKTAYRNMLHNIVTEIRHENFINFGDVYVEAINGGILTLGMDICYGSKAGFEWLNIPELGPLPVPTPKCYRKIVGPNSKMVYPASASPRAVIRLVYVDGSENVTDPYMEAVLNRDITHLIPTNIKNVILQATKSNYKNDDRYPKLCSLNDHFDIYEVYPHAYSDNDYVEHGKLYRDDIYARFPPLTLSSLYPGFSHFWGYCNWFVGQTSLIPIEYCLMNGYGISQICKFKDPVICYECIYYPLTE